MILKIIDYLYTIFLAIKANICKRKLLFIFIKYTVLFTILLLSIASLAMYHIISDKLNPFLYANF